MGQLFRVEVAFRTLIGKQCTVLIQVADQTASHFGRKLSAAFVTSEKLSRLPDIAITSVLFQTKPGILEITSRISRIDTVQYRF